MFRLARLLFVASLAVLLYGCKTSEIKNGNDIGLVNDIPSGDVQSGYGDGKGDSVGGGGGGPAVDSRISKGEASR